MVRAAWTLTIFLILSLAATCAYSQSTSATQIKKIDSYAKVIDRYSRSSSNKIVAADVADFDSIASNWKLFDSEQALERYRKTSETYTIAFNWRRNGKIVASNFTMFSPSGDWTKYAFHYFRTDGSLALVRSELRTFQGDYTIKEDRYFDVRGRLLMRRVRYYDLMSGKRKRPTKEVLEDDPSLYKVDYFLNVSKLPFAKLISQKE